MQQKNVGFVEAKKYIKLTKEPLHEQIVQILEQLKTNYTYWFIINVKIGEEHAVRHFQFIPFFFHFQIKGIVILINS